MRNMVAVAALALAASVMPGVANAEDIGVMACWTKAVSPNGGKAWCDSGSAAYKVRIECKHNGSSFRKTVDGSRKTAPAESVTRCDIGYTRVGQIRLVGA